ncbi:MAG: UDP-N-acetylenolpyruvoylglucosamine reductase [Chloroflexi bacterium HGW-Chloroflexi-10]|nr:MAG: UDP-N-acetylenolpyruvoylglucosamine reductase [Chloroflexi bacterium HGW-Chloroflexi-10]
MKLVPEPIKAALKNRFGRRFQEQTPLSGLTTAHVGGPAEVLISIETGTELSETCQYLWENDIPMLVMGAGSNLLFSEDGFFGVILLNRTKRIEVIPTSTPPQIFAESGANLGMLARKAALAGIAGLEWASTVPGTVGGAVYGNAGAFGGDIHGNLLLAEILQRNEGRQTFTNETMEYAYRSSILKRQPRKSVIISAVFTGTQDDPIAIQERMRVYSERRRSTQPPGASMGSMFKNPQGDYAGRLIEAAGLKGTQIGGARISEIHANFFVNSPESKSNDIWQLVQLAQAAVFDKFQVKLELEVEAIGFSSQPNNGTSSIGKAV